MIHKKLLSLLALLMMAATGAWAVGVEAKIGTTEYATLAQALSSAQDGDIIQLQSDVVLNNTQISVEKGITIDFNGYIISSADDTSGIWWTVDMTFIDSDDTGRGGMKCIYGREDGTEAKANLCGGRYDDSAENLLTGPYASFFNFPTGYEIVNINADGSADAEGFISRVVRNYLNDDMTEATFTMPAFDATVNYDIVRDMEDATYPVEFSGLSQKVVVKKKTGSEAYEPVTPLTIQLIDQLAATDAQNIISADGIKVKVLKGTDNNGTITYDETNTLTLAEFTANMQPGLYKMVAEPTDPATSPYTGTASLAFQTLTGYPVEVAANGFVTYYSDEKLTINDEAAGIYTVQQVTGNKAVLSSAINVAPANTPLIIYNTSDEPKTFLLIPTDGDADEVSYAAQFKGTLVDKEMPGSDDETDYYVCNGFDFAWVKQAGTLAANRCWLEITNQSQGARYLSIVFGDGTGLNAIGNGQLTNADGDLYDLNGRKVGSTFNVQRSTLKKGVYIRNGKKVIKK